MIRPKVMPCKASRPMDLLEYSTTISPAKHSGFFPVGYWVGRRENNVHSGLTAICFGKHLNVEWRNYSRFLVIHPSSILCCWDEENTNLSVLKKNVSHLLHEHNSNEYCKEFLWSWHIWLSLECHTSFDSLNVKHKPSCPAFFPPAWSKLKLLQDPGDNCMQRKDL